MQYVVRITKEGADAKTSVDMNDFALREDTNMLKSYLEGSGSVALNAGNSRDVTVTINHNFGYKPMVIAYITDPNNSDRWARCPYWNPVGGNDIVGVVQRPNVNDVELHIYKRSPASTDSTVYYKYRILIEPKIGAWYA